MSGMPRVAGTLAANLSGHLPAGSKLCPIQCEFIFHALNRSYVERGLTKTLSAKSRWMGEQR